MKSSVPLLLLVFLFSIPVFVFPQAQKDSVLQNGSLQNCIAFALAHQPSVQQSLLDQEITEKEIQSKLSDWYPQINFNLTFQHNTELPTSIIQGNPVKFGLNNTSSGQFSLTQAIFNKDVLLASRTSDAVREQAKQFIEKLKIDLVVNVSKTFYSVLLSREQVKLLDEDISRLQRSYEDALNQYKSGIVDKTDYKRASISLNNAKAAKKQNEELLNTRIAYLKELMGYPSSAELKLEYDTTRMEEEAFIDTSITLNYQNRVEYRLLQTQQDLQEANLNYYKWSFIPSLSAFGNYNLNFMNNDFQKLYNKNYPSSYFGLQLSWPIFQGGKRIQQIQQADLELDRTALDLIALRNSINTEFIQALSNYKSSLNNYNAQKENMALAKEVFNTIELQYKSGIKTYLELITSETDLRTTEINYLDALYQLLSSKLDVQKAVGVIKY